jgi:transposase
MILAMDNASWHSSKIDAGNIVPLFQPAHSPELNPAERVWKHIREKQAVLRTGLLPIWQMLKQQYVRLLMIFWKYCWCVNF